MAVNNAAHVVLRGLTIECCEGTAVLLADSSHCLVAGNTIRNVGGRCNGNDAAVAVRGGHDDAVVGNDIYEAGSFGILLAGGDRKTLDARQPSPTTTTSITPAWSPSKAGACACTEWATGPRTT